MVPRRDIAGKWALVYAQDRCCAVQITPTGDDAPSCTNNVALQGTLGLFHVEQCYDVTATLSATCSGPQLAELREGMVSFAKMVCA